MEKGEKCRARPYGSTVRAPRLQGFPNKLPQLFAWNGGLHERLAYEKYVDAPASEPLDIVSGGYAAFGYYGYAAGYHP